MTLNIRTNMEKNPVESWLSRLSPLSRASASGSIRSAEALLFGEGVVAWHLVGVDELSRLASHLSEGKSQATVSKEMSFVKEVIRECWRLGLKSHEDLQRVTSLRWSRPAAPPCGRHVDREDRNKIIEACGDDPQGLRNRAVVRLLLAGLRRVEVTVVRTSDFSSDMSFVNVVGKGGRRRQVPLGRRASADLRAYLSVRGRDRDGFFILPREGGAFVRAHRPITSRAINKIIRKVAGRAKVPFTPHDLRRTAIGEWLGGVDISVAMNMAGHSNPQTTVRYDRRSHDEAAKRAASFMD
jgi:integrase